MPMPAAASEALARKQGCLGCHAQSSTLVGPAYRAIAERYAGQPDAVSTLAASIRQGGSGKWGEMAMPPQAQLSPADAKRLATWVLASAKAKPQ
jgi:cytochrome c